MTKIIAIIPAAGMGSRMKLQHNKAFLKIAGESIIQRTLKTFLSVRSFDEIIVMVNPDEEQEMIKQISKIKKTPYPEIQIIYGGKTRQDSVRLGLEYIAKKREVKLKLSDNPGNFYEEIKSLYESGKDRMLCLVHDGARCLIDLEMLEAYITELKEDYVGLGVAVPVQDTIRRVDSANMIIETPERSSLRAMQTPQGSDFEVLLKAHRLAKENKVQVNDDIAALEFVKYPVKLYPGNMKNIKITYPEDIAIAEKLLKIE